MSDRKTKEVLQELTSKDQPNLTEKEKQVLKQLAVAFEKASEDAVLNDSEKVLVKEIISKSKTGSITPSDLINFVRVVLQVGDFFKDST